VCLSRLSSLLRATSSLLFLGEAEADLAGGVVLHQCNGPERQTIRLALYVKAKLKKKKKKKKKKISTVAVSSWSIVSLAP